MPVCVFSQRILENFRCSCSCSCPTSVRLYWFEAGFSFPCLLPAWARWQHASQGQMAACQGQIVGSLDRWMLQMLVPFLDPTRRPGTVHVHDRLIAAVALALRWPVRPVHDRLIAVRIPIQFLTSTEWSQFLASTPQSLGRAAFLEQSAN